VSSDRPEEAQLDRVSSLIPQNSYWPTTSPLPSFRVPRAESMTDADLSIKALKELHISCLTLGR
jgi:hypothetical protein